MGVGEERKREETEFGGRADMKQLRKPHITHISNCTHTHSELLTKLSSAQVESKKIVLRLFR